MRFIKLLAILLFVWGAMRLGMELYVAIVFEGAPSAASRYLGSQTSGEAIDQGNYRILFASMVLLIVRLLRNRQQN